MAQLGEQWKGIGTYALEFLDFKLDNVQSADGLQHFQGRVPRCGDAFIAFTTRQANNMRGVDVSQFTVFAKDNDGKRHLACYSWKKSPKFGDLSVATCVWTPVVGGWPHYLLDDNLDLWIDIVPSEIISSDSFALMGIYEYAHREGGDTTKRRIVDIHIQERGPSHLFLEK